MFDMRELKIQDERMELVGKLITAPALMLEPRRIVDVTAFCKCLTVLRMLATSQNEAKAKTLEPLYLLVSTLAAGDLAQLHVFKKPHRDPRDMTQISKLFAGYMACINWKDLDQDTASEATLMMSLSRVFA